MGKASLRPLCCLHHRGPPAVPSFRSAAMVLLLLAFAPWGRVPCPTMLHAAAGPTTCQCATTTPHNSRVACPALSYSVPPWVWVAVLLRDLSGRWRSLLLTSRALPAYLGYRYFYMSALELCCPGPWNCHRPDRGGGTTKMEALANINVSLQ
ncbi:uncharacterized protein LOC110436346 isoform X2 [Sorghum bicolor]|uniref:uncharacterized protein LOC110436346 isoform X2 n=1 Tax=Sorghum bicolor TaxID=4558 RepID=UPI000B4243D8|nr:uncharacterized protein LOC110436346 isoform X2 [Sorghum bicolor]|eukprot:XP_021318900.1 uncharacterized protein LOC110436346 isoform X2 [Sorghum bicolor]